LPGINDRKHEICEVLEPRFKLQASVYDEQPRQCFFQCIFICKRAYNNLFWIRTNKSTEAQEKYEHVIPTGILGYVIFIAVGITESIFVPKTI
jgi:hypothetical protein